MPTFLHHHACVQDKAAPPPASSPAPTPAPFEAKKQEPKKVEDPKQAEPAKAAAKKVEAAKKDVKKGQEVKGQQKRKTNGFKLFASQLAMLGAVVAFAYGLLFRSEQLGAVLAKADDYLMGVTTPAPAPRD